MTLSCFGAGSLSAGAFPVAWRGPKPRQATQGGGACRGWRDRGRPAQQPDIIAAGVVVIGIRFVFAIELDCMIWHLKATPK